MVRAEQLDRAGQSDDAFDALYSSQLSVNGSHDNGSAQQDGFRPMKCVQALTAPCTNASLLQTACNHLHVVLNERRAMNPRDCRLKTWPRKADLFIMRTDGRSCSRETVKGGTSHMLHALNMAACCNCRAVLRDRTATKL